MKYLTFLFFGLILISCTQTTPDLTRIEAEIYNAEKAFNEMAASEGIAKAFVYFADDSAVLMRGKNLIKGKSAIKELYENQDLSNATLVWKPDFVKVAESGELAYTYGNFEMTMVVESGDTLSDTGVFHTIWLRQEDGSWKYVWD